MCCHSNAGSDLSRVVHAALHAADTWYTAALRLRLTWGLLWPQEEEERAQWDRAVQEKAAREEELERSIMAQEAESSSSAATKGTGSAAKGVVDTKQAAPKSLLNEKQLAAGAANGSAGIKSLEAALAEKDALSGACWRCAPACHGLAAQPRHVTWVLELNAHGSGQACSKIG